MGFPDALLFTFLALGDAALLVYLRYRRRQSLKFERMTRSLRFAIERENCERDLFRRHRTTLLRQAS